MNTTLRTLLSALAGAALATTLVPALREAVAQPRRPATLPTDCSSGDLVVYESGQFVCRSPRRALALSSCNSGDFVVWNGSELHCEHASSTSWGARNLLPDCSSGNHLVSEGFGRWRCVDNILPSCSSGEIMASEGSGRWRCAPMPSGH